MEELLILLERDDHTNVPALDGLYKRYHTKPGFCAAVVDATVSGRDQLCCNGSHLLYTFVKADEKIKPVALQTLKDNLQSIEHWAGRMSVARIIGMHPDWFVDSAEHVAEHLRLWCEDTNAFLRAWAIDAFVRFADAVPELREEAMEWFDKGEHDPKAAVKARMRKLKPWLEERLATAMG